MASMGFSQDAQPALESPTVESRETEWSKHLAKSIPGAVVEFRLPDSSRVDIETDSVSWEVEWCDKWEQSFGQAAGYAAQTGKKPGVWLLKRGQQDDEDYLRAAMVCQWFRSHGAMFEFRVTDVK